MVTASMGSVWGDGVVTSSAATAKVKIDKKAFPDSKSRSLQKLFCKPNKLTKLDVRKNKKLTAKGGIIDADKGVKIIKK